MIQSIEVMQYLYNKTFRCAVKAVYLSYGCPYDVCPYPNLTCANCSHKLE